MIRDINNKSNIVELNRIKLPNYWTGYFDYETNTELSSLSKHEFLKIITNEKTKPQPFIRSQVVISKLLTEFGEKHNFHRQFRENHPELDSAQILGMQLYHILIQDADVWTYYPMKESGHLFSHSTYFK